MNTLFKVKVKYLKIDEHGKQVKANENYIVEAINFTEAETRIHEIMEQYGVTTPIVAAVSKSNITEVVNYEDGQHWYQSKIVWADQDDNGKITKVTNHFLIAANDIKQTCDRIEDSLDAMMIDYDVTGISKSNILDVFPLVNEEEK